jgi:K+-transporting ATPase ATPase A chain
MLGLTVQNFVSAATGMAVLVALIRSFRRASTSTIGNFWTDLVRTIFYILLPLSLVLAVVLVSQGVVQTFMPYKTVELVQPVTYDNPKTDASGQAIKDEKGNPVTEPATAKEQTIAVGPAAPDRGRRLGTTVAASSTSTASFEIRRRLTPSSCCDPRVRPRSAAFGTMVRDTRQGWAVLAAMTIVFVALLALCAWAESRGNPVLAGLGVDQTASVAQPGGNMEGKEARFGVVNSALWATATTAASNGSVNAMHDSFTPLGGLVPMWLIQLGEVIYGASARASMGCSCSRSSQYSSPG